MQTRNEEKVENRLDQPLRRETEAVVGVRVALPDKDQNSIAAAASVGASHAATSVWTSGRTGRRLLPNPTSNPIPVPTTTPSSQNIALILDPRRSPPESSTLQNGRWRVTGV